MPCPPVSWRPPPAFDCRVWLLSVLDEHGARSPSSFIIIPDNDQSPPPARLRSRSQVPLAELEGVQEHLASVGSNTLLVTSGQALMNSMLNGHEQPAVLSAVMKQQMTTRMRQNINDGMDVRECDTVCDLALPSLFVFFSSSVGPAAAAGG